VFHVKHIHFRQAIQVCTVFHAKHSARSRSPTLFRDSHSSTIETNNLDPTRRGFPSCSRTFHLKHRLCSTWNTNHSTPGRTCFRARERSRVDARVSHFKGRALVVSNASGENVALCFTWNGRNVSRGTLLKSGVHITAIDSCGTGKHFLFACTEFRHCNHRSTRTILRLALASPTIEWEE